MNQLVHINQIEYIPSARLSGMKFPDTESCILPADVNFTKFNDLTGLVSVKQEDSFQNGQRIYTVTATFSLRCKQLLSGKRISFRLTTVSGEQYLLGTATRPYPIIKESNPFPEKEGDSILRQLTVTWKSTWPLLRILT